MRGNRWLKRANTSRQASFCEMIQLDEEGKSHIYFCFLIEANQKPMNMVVKQKAGKNVTIYAFKSYSRKSRHFITTVPNVRGISLQLVSCANYHKSTMWNEEVQQISAVMCCSG